MRRLIIIPVLIVIAVVLVFLISQRQKANTLPENVIYSSGTVESNAVTASAQIMGKVIEKRHKKGDMVTKGDTLALIERDMLESKQRELSASEASTESDLAAARIDLENSKKNLTRMQEAYKAGSVPQKDLDNLNAAYQSGDKRVQSLQARIEMLQSQMHFRSRRPRRPGTPRRAARVAGCERENRPGRAA